MPTLIRRNLTFNFQRAVTIIDGVSVAQAMEVAITPLATPSFPDLGTYVGGVQEQTVVLNSINNTAVFQLVPSNASGLTEPVAYLAAFRQGGITGSTITTPFSMPDADTEWDALPDLGDILGGASFLQQSDLGVAGRVAKLNDSGQVVDVNGNPVAMPTSVTSVNDALVTETEARIAAATALETELEGEIVTQAATTLASAKAYTDTNVSTLVASIGSEAGARANAITTLTGTVTSDVSTLQGQINTLDTTVGTHTTEIAAKADLDGGGHVPIGEIPAAAITSWIPVANTSAMLALTYPTQVQVGDVAYTPTAAYVLTTTDPTQLSHWRNFQTVASVNGKTGVVVLSAADVGAVDASSGTVAISQVTGLATALSTKAVQTDMTAAESAITAIQGDTTYVHTSSGVISDSVLPANIALLDGSNNITNKAGTPVPIGSVSGVSQVNGHQGVVTLAAADVGAIATSATNITESQIVNLTTDLAARVLSSDSRLTNARTPTAHASTHASAGSDPVTVSQSQVTGLSTALGLLATQADMTTVEGEITTINSTLVTKADLVSGVLKSTQIPTGIPLANVSALTGYLTHLNSSGLLDAAYLTNITNIPAIGQGSITGLVTALTGKADLTGPGGTVPAAQLPASQLVHTFTATSQVGMVALTGARQGDFCVITTGPNLGTYILAAADPTVLGNWTLLLFPGEVNSVNGHTGVVTLAAADVGAIATGATNIGQSQITGLTAALATFATTTALSTAVSGLQSASQVQAALVASSVGKQVANYVATSPIASLSGQQSIDGVVTPLASVVLATAQSSSVNNGLWIVNSGAWTRTADFATGAYLLKGTLVVVSQGTVNANTLWQVTSVSSVIDTGISNWAKIGSVAGQLAYTQGNGITIIGTQVAAKAATGGGLAVGSGGIGLDTALAVRKVIGTVPSTGSRTITITHSLNNLAPSVTIVDTASGNIVDLGSTVVDANNVSCEFASAPASGQYRYQIVG